MSSEEFPGSAAWIGMPLPGVGNHTGAVPSNLHLLFRRTFSLARLPERATLRISADDFALLYVNGRLVWGGPAPGYLHRYYYAELDLLPWLRPGDNVLAVHSYYQGLVNRVWNSGDGFYGLIAELSLIGADASAETIVTDPQWRCQRCDAYQGHRMFGYETQFAEDIDQRLIPVGWRQAEFDDSGWAPAVDLGRGVYPHCLVLQETPPLEFREVRPALCRRVGPGAWLYDFGVEVVGSTMIRVDAPAGTGIEVRHAEELDGHGRARYRMRANCEYQEFCTLDGSGEPLEFFDYKGFRYVELIGVEDPGETAVTVLRRRYPLDPDAGGFKSSDARMNRVWEICRHAVMVGTQDSYLDCPTREKGAYLGDAVVTGLAHLCLSGDMRILRKVLADFAASSVYSPGIKAVAPGAFMQDIADYSLLWAPLLREYYWWSGDDEFVAAMLPVLDGLLEFFGRYRNHDGLLADFTATPVMVDWPNNLRDGYDDPGLMGVDVPQQGINTVLNLYYCLTLDAAAGLLETAGDRARAEALTEQAETLRHHLVKQLSRHGLMVDTDRSAHSSLHANALALFCGLEPEAGAEKMIALIREKRLSCGVFFAFFLLQGLYNSGEADLAYELMTCNDERSWMTMVNAGASACLEAWGPDQKWNTSWCHPWAAAPVIMVASELFGLRPAEPGWRKIAFRPQIPAGLEQAELRLTIPQGRIDVSFRQRGDAIEFFIDLPDGCDMSCRFQERFSSIAVNGKQVRG